MRTVYKYALGAPVVTLTMPSDARILHVAEQGHVAEHRWDIQLWALVDTDNQPEDRLFRIYGTGHVVDQGLTFIGTVLADNGLVWHVFEGPT